MPELTPAPTTVVAPQPNGIATPEGTPLRAIAGYDAQKALLSPKQGSRLPLSTLQHAAREVVGASRSRWLSPDAEFLSTIEESAAGHGGTGEPAPENVGGWPLASWLLGQAELFHIANAGAAKASVASCGAEGALGGTPTLDGWLREGRPSYLGWMHQPAWAFYADNIVPVTFLGQSIGKVGGLHKDVAGPLKAVETEATKRGVTLPAKTGANGFRFQPNGGKGGRHPRGQAIDFRSVQNPHLSVGNKNNPADAGKLRYTAIYVLTDQWLLEDGGAADRTRQLVQRRRRMVADARAEGVEPPPLSECEVTDAMATYHRLVHVQQQLKDAWAQLGGPLGPGPVDPSRLEALRSSLSGRVSERLSEELQLLAELPSLAPLPTLKTSAAKAEARAKRLEIAAKPSKKPGKPRGARVVDPNHAVPERLAEAKVAREEAKHASEAWAEGQRVAEVRSQLESRIASLQALGATLDDGKRAGAFLTTRRTTVAAKKPTSKRRGAKDDGEIASGLPAVPVTRLHATASNPSLEQLADTGLTDMPPALVEAFVASGWTWGGSWKGNADAMHFEYTGPAEGVIDG
jgi:hypothetical protein